MTPDPHITILAATAKYGKALQGALENLKEAYPLDIRTGEWEALLEDTAALAKSVLLVLDVGEKTGYRPLHILNILRTIPAARCLPVMVVTTARDDEKKKQALGLGVDEFIVLPASKQEIAEIAERLITSCTAGDRANCALSNVACAGRRYLARALDAEARVAEKEQEIGQLISVQDSLFELSRQELLEARAEAKRSLQDKVDAINEKSELQMAFGKYISPDILSQLIKEDGLHNLSGESKDISIMFADIRGFTSLAETLNAEEVVSLLNEFFTDLTKIIITHTGFIDKYIGDCIMAIFGAPAPLSQHHHLALLAAVKMMDRYQELRSVWKKRYGRDIGMGIGINSGSAVVGTIGSFQKISYTAIGDTVNTASRMEDISGDGEILFPLSVRERIRETFLKRHSLRVVERGEASIKGKEGVHAIFNLERIRDGK